MRRSLVLAFAFISIGLLGGCASIITGTNQEVTFHSTPEEATVSVGGKTLGKTPLTTSLKKRSGQSLVFEKEGYKTITLQLETRMNGWFWGNIIFGGLVGSTTDNLSGAVNEYSPNQYMVTLESAGTGTLDGKTSGSKSQAVRGYIVSGYNDIRSELSKGSGPYVTTLLKMLDVPESEKDAAVKKIKALSEVYTIIPEFADHVIALYIK